MEPRNGNLTMKRAKRRGAPAKGRVIKVAMPTDAPASIDADLAAFAAEQGLVRDGETAVWTALAGGVSSDIWRNGGEVRYAVSKFRERKLPAAGRRRIDADK